MGRRHRRLSPAATNPTHRGCELFRRASFALLKPWSLCMPDFTQLTDRQREIYEFIRDKIETRGYGPTVREIGLGFEIRSPNGVMCHLKALEKKGLIKREGFSARAIQLLDYYPPHSGLPFLGAVAAGAP